MSKGKSRGNDIDFGDLDLDSALDIPGFGPDGFNLSDDRKPISQFKSSFKSTMVSRATNRTMINRLISISLPKGYSQAFNAYDGIRRGLGDIYKENQSDLQPFMQRAGRAIERNTPRIWRMMPKSIQKAFAEKREQSGYQEQSELETNLGDVSKLFEFTKANAKADKIKQASNELLEKKRFELQMQGSEAQARLLGRIVNYQDTILISYHRKALEIGFRHYDVSLKSLVENRVFQEKNLELLATIGKNSALPDFVKMNHEEALKDSLRRKLMDAMSGGISGWAGNYFKGMKERAGQLIQGASLGLSMANSGGMGEGMTKAQMAGMAGGSLAAGYAAEKLQPVLEYLAMQAANVTGKSERVGAIGNVLRSIFTAGPQRLNRWARSTTEREGLMGGVIDAIKALVDQYDPATKIRGDGVESLGDVAKFDNLFHKSVTEIIPAYMASMDKSLRELVTGQPQEEYAWSHYTGGMVSRKTLNQQNVRIAIKQSQGDNIRSEVDGLMRELNTGELTPQAKRALRRRLLSDLQSGLNFEATDYVKYDAWPEVDESVANELVEFFSDEFQIDTEGNYTGNNASTTRRRDAEQYFDEVSKRIPNVRQRMAAMSSHLGRRTWRELGLTRYDGVEGDTLMIDAFNRMILGEDHLGDDDLSSNVPDLKLPAFDPKDPRGSMAKRAAHQKAYEEQIKALAERRERESLMLGEKDEVDVTSGGLNSVIKAQFGGLGDWTKKTSSPVQSTKSGKPDRYNFKLRDQGTHQRLDKIIELMTGGGSFGPNGGGTGPTGPSKLDSILESAGRVYNKALDKAGNIKDEAAARYQRAEQYVKNHPRVKRGLAHIERMHGKITDPELRASVLEAIYSRTGTPEEISNKLKDKYGKLSKAALGYRDQAGDWIRDKTSPAAKERYRAQAMGYLEQGREWVDDHTNAEARAGYGARMRELYGNARDRASGYYDSARQGLGGFANWARDRGQGLSDRLGAVSVRDEELIALVTQLLEVGAAHGELLEQIAAGGGGGGDATGTPGAKPSGGFFGKLRGLLGRGIRATGNGIVGAGKLYGKGVLWGYKKMFQGMGLGLKGMGLGIKGLFKSRDKLGITDVFVVGNPDPVMKAGDIRRGFYVDAESNEPITAMKDIKGAVIDVRTGEFAVTQEEYDKGLRQANGESIFGYTARRAAGVGTWAAKAGAAYMTGTYGLMWKAAKFVGNLTIDQFTQFDAYFPGDDEPRIRSKLLKKGYYRNKDGEAILSLNDIKGAVYDVDDNEVISEEDWSKYKSLYTRNGSVLFTIGRGVTSVASWAGKTAMKLGLGYAKMVGKAYLWAGKKMWGAAKWAGGKVWGGLKALANRFRKGGTGSTPGLGSSDDLKAAAFDVSIEQLKVQQAILQILSGGERKKGDFDGDGIVENSWMDLGRKRAARKARGPNAEVVDAIHDLRDTLTGTGKKGAKDEEDKGIIDRMKDMFGGLGDFFGGRKKGLFGKLGGLLGRGGKWLGGAAMGVGRFGLSRLAIPAAIALGKGALAVGSGLLSVVGAPVLLGVAAVAGLAYVGYKIYQNAKIDDKPIYYLRMTQYGVSPTSEPHVEKMLALEALVKPGVVGIETASPSLDPSRFEVSKVEPLFGITPKQEGVEEDPDNEERRQKLYWWIGNRFKPVYLAHCRAALKLANTLELSEMDNRIKGEQLKDLLSYALPPGISAAYDKTEYSPFEDDLDMDADDVEDIVDRIQKLIKKAPSQPKLTTKDGVLSEASKAQTVLGVASTATGGKEVSKITEELTKEAKLNGQRGMYRGRGPVQRHTDQYIPESRRSKLDLSSATRFQTYGLVELTLDKVEDLYKVEELFWDRLEFDDTKHVDLTGDMREHEQKVQAIFKAGTFEQKAQVDMWLKYRFLPAFFQYALGIRRNYNGPVKEGNTKVSGDSLKAILRSVSEVTTQVDGVSVSVWTITYSPWLGYRLGDDPSVVKQYIDSVKTAAPGPLPVEGLIQKSDEGVSAKDDYSKYIMGKATASKKDQFGKQTYSGNVLGNMRSLYEGVGTTGGSVLMSIPGNAGPMGNVVPHPGGGSGGDVNQLPDSGGKGASANRALIVAAAKMVGLDPDIAMTIAGVESSWDPNAGAGTSSAKGLFQITSETWGGLMAAHGKKYGLNPNAGPLDPKANAILGCIYVRDGYHSLKQSNPDVNVTDQTLYMAHFLGYSGAARWLRQAPGTPSSQAVSQSAYIANLPIFTDKGRELTVGEVNAKLAGRMAAIRKAAGSSTSVASAGQPGDTYVTTPASPTASIAEAAGAGTIGIMAPTNAPKVNAPEGATTPALPSAPDATPPVNPELAAQVQQQASTSTQDMVRTRNESEARHAEMGSSVSNILSQHLQELKTSNQHLVEIKQLLSRLGSLPNQPPAQPQVPAPAAPMTSRGTTSSRRQGAMP